MWCGYMVIGIIIVLIIFSILFMPLGIKIQKNDYFSDVDIYLTKFFNIKIDFDDFVRLFLTSRKNRDEITVESVVNNIRLFKEFQNIIEEVFKFCHIKHLTIIVNGQFNEIGYETYFRLSSEIFFEVLNEYLLQVLKKFATLIIQFKNQKVILKI